MEYGKISNSESPKIFPLKTDKSERITNIIRELQIEEKFIVKISIILNDAPLSHTD